MFSPLHFHFWPFLAAGNSFLLHSIFSFYISLAFGLAWFCPLVFADEQYFNSCISLKITAGCKICCCDSTVFSSAGHRADGPVNSAQHSAVIQGPDGETKGQLNRQSLASTRFKQIARIQQVMCCTQKQTQCRCTAHNTQQDVNWTVGVSSRTRLDLQQGSNFKLS